MSCLWRPALTAHSVRLRRLPASLRLPLNSLAGLPGRIIRIGRQRQHKIANLLAPAVYRRSPRRGSSSALRPWPCGCRHPRGSGRASCGCRRRWRRCRHPCSTAAGHSRARLRKGADDEAIVPGAVENAAGRLAGGRKRRLLRLVGHQFHAVEHARPLMSPTSGWSARLFSPSSSRAPALRPLSSRPPS